MNESGPKTLIDAVKHFADLGVCFRYMIQLKYPDGKITCPKCGKYKVGVIASRSMLQCKDKECRKQFSAKVGSIFEDSPLPLSSWFVAVWCIANAKNGISSCELARALGVTQKSAWFMLHRIRLAMKTPSYGNLDEQVFRFNARAKTDAGRFAMVMGAVLGKRITYRSLCAIDGCGFMGIE